MQPKTLGVLRKTPPFLPTGRRHLRSIRFLQVYVRHLSPLWKCFGPGRLRKRGRPCHSFAELSPLHNCSFGSHRYVLNFCCFPFLIFAFCFFCFEICAIEILLRLLTFWKAAWATFFRLKHFLWPAIVSTTYPPFYEHLVDKYEKRVKLNLSKSLRSSLRS